MSKRIYFAGPLFCTAERDYNTAVRDALAAAGFDVFLPQESSLNIDKGCMDDPVKKTEMGTKIFGKDLDEVRNADILVINLDGRVPDEGACVELGYAYALDKPCFAIKTDVRTAEFGVDNLMTSGAVGNRIAGSVDELVRMISSCSD